MKITKIKDWQIKLTISVVLIVICSFYFINIPNTSSWLHDESTVSGSFKIGRIDFQLNGIEDDNVNLSIDATAPTKFFAESGRDENFDIAVTKYQIAVKNVGDVDLNIDLSCTDNNSSNYQIFYIFVPATTTDNNFLTGKYRDYLDTAFSGYSLTTNSLRKSAMNSINTATLNANKGLGVPVGVQNSLFYLLVWSEYDNIDYVTSSQYNSCSYTITLTANGYQSFM